MISWLKGKVIRTFAGGAVIDVNNLGYKVFLVEKNIKLDQQIECHVHQHLREDQSHLYGFLRLEELELFELLLTVSGVGPKMALSLLAKSSVSEIKESIDKGQAGALQAVPGVGSKIAAKIVIELRSKIASGVLDLNRLDESGEIVDALINLGLSKLEARDIVKEMPKDLSTPADQVKWALKRLGKKTN